MEQERISLNARERERLKVLHEIEQAGGSRPTLAVDGPAGAAVMDTLAYRRRWRAGSPTAGTSLESENP